MKTLNFVSALFALSATLTAQAAPCFHVGKYSGKGFAIDKQGKAYAYDVTTTIDDNSKGSSDYTWSPNQSVHLSFVAKDGSITFDGSAKSAGTIRCDLGQTEINLKSPALTLNEQWVNVGNYLIRHGVKTVDGAEISYQELLIQQN